MRGKFCERCKETEERTDKQRRDKSLKRETGTEQKANSTASEQRTELTNRFKNQYCKTKNKGIIEKSISWFKIKKAKEISIKSGDRRKDHGKNCSKDK